MFEFFVCEAHCGYESNRQPFHHSIKVIVYLADEPDCLAEGTGSRIK